MRNDGELVCTDITKIYDTGDRALSSINFSVPTRGVFTLIGRNGAGKTTLTRILATLLEPTSGVATIDGLDVMNDANELRERMAVVPQEARPIPWMTPLQMISSYLMWRGISYRESRRRAEEAVVRVGLEDSAHRLSRTLSGGMKRKALVAMVIAADADFIFLDEPTTGLDPISRQDIWTLLTELGEKRFLFLTTHYLEEAEMIADRVGILDDGTLLALGNMDELRMQLGYQYSVRIHGDIDLPPLNGRVLAGRDGQVQVITTQDEAMYLSDRLIDRNVKFSVNPITLEDIFYHVVGRDIDTENRWGWIR
ncbi:MAG: ABC transporter ATP-binding protein [Euryarchaeota archaeon]|nr:ABC transporter ATP-binding protein [Euryarchaeota archaeon]